MIHRYEEARVNLSCDAHFSHGNMHECTSETRCDPEYKCDYGFKVLTYNINELKCQAELDQCGDETFMGHAEHGKSGSSDSSRIINKPDISKDMQTIIISDVHVNRPRACIHSHKLYLNFSMHRKEHWTTTPGGREVRRILEELKSLIEGGI